MASIKGWLPSKLILLGQQEWKLVAEKGTSTSKLRQQLPSRACAQPCLCLELPTIWRGLLAGLHQPAFDQPAGCLRSIHVDVLLEHSPSECASVRLNRLVRPATSLQDSPGITKFTISTTFPGTTRINGAASATALSFSA